MFERFNEPARQVVVLAEDEALFALKHGYVGTEHLLLGLLREQDGVAARALEQLDITLEGVRAQVARIVGTGETQPVGRLPFTPRAKHVLELALRDRVGTAHLLLGVVRENRGVAARVLLDLGADAEKVRNHVIRVLADPQGPREAGAGDERAKPTPGAPETAAEEISRKIRRLSDGALNKAIDGTIDELIREEQDFISRRRSLQEKLHDLRAERERRGRDDG